MQQGEQEPGNKNSWGSSSVSLAWRARISWDFTSSLYKLGRIPGLGSGTREVYVCPSGNLSLPGT